MDRPFARGDAVRLALPSSLPGGQGLLPPARAEGRRRRRRRRDVPDGVAPHRRHPTWRSGSALAVRRRLPRDRSPLAKRGTSTTARRPDAGDQRGAASGADDAVVAADQRRLVLDAAARLSDKDADVLRLAAWEQLSTADIAAVLGIAPNAVKQRLHRAKQHLGREYRKLESGTHKSTPHAPKGGAR